MDLATKPTGRRKVEALQSELEKLPQYEPQTRHYFHAGMYCREVFRDANVLVVGKVHKREHFYVICSGRVAITDGDGPAKEVSAPAVIRSMPGTKRAVLSLEPTVCMTFHVCEAKTVEEAEAELVEDEPSLFSLGNVLKTRVLS